MKRECFKISKKFQTAFIHFRTSVKILTLFLISLITAIVIIFVVYKPIYAVSLNGEFLGYSQDKFKLQTRINEYIEYGDRENIAFVQIDQLPEYEICFLKKGITTNDEEIFNKITQTGTNYYTYYSIAQDGEDKLYVKDFNIAEQIVEELKQKDSANKDTIEIEEKYDTELKDFVNKEEAVAKLYVSPDLGIKSSVQMASTFTSRGGEKVSTANNITSKKLNLGISLIQPVTGAYKITSKYGNRSSIRSGPHTGLDIAISRGTPIKAAASGKVVFAGTKGSYGKLIVISHGNGVQTYYGHCDQLLASVGQTVSQGSVIAKVGSTGNSTGYHLHLEIRVNGQTVNPQYYLY